MPRAIGWTTTPFADLHMDGATRQTVELSSKWPSDAASSPSMETGMNVMHESKVSCSTATGLNFGRSVSSGMCAPARVRSSALTDCAGVCPLQLSQRCALHSYSYIHASCAIIPDQRERRVREREGVCVYMEARVCQGGPASRSRCKNADAPRAFGSSRAVGESRLYPSTHMFDAPSVFAAASTSAYLRHRSE